MCIRDRVCEDMLTNKPYADEAAVKTAFDAAVATELETQALAAINKATAETMAAVIATYADALGLDPVSYTHLDVYKRQGVRKEALEDAYKLADFSGIKVDLESMTVFPVDADGKQLTQDDKPVTGLDSLVETMVKEKSWLLGAGSGSGSGQVGGGTNPPGAGGGEANPWKAETFNLTNQAKILQENPALAARLKQEAGVK